MIRIAVLRTVAFTTLLALPLAAQQATTPLLSLATCCTCHQDADAAGRHPGGDNGDPRRRLARARNRPGARCIA